MLTRRSLFGFLAAAPVAVPAALAASSGPKLPTAYEWADARSRARELLDTFVPERLPWLHLDPPFDRDRFYALLAERLGDGIARDIASHVAHAEGVA